MLLSYQRAERGRPAVTTCRGIWELTFRPFLIQAWDAIALGHDAEGLVVVEDLIDADCIKSHGDARQLLKPSRPVIRPVSLRQIQIQIQHMLQEGRKG